LLSGSIIGEVRLQFGGVRVGFQDAGKRSADWVERTLKKKVALPRRQGRPRVEVGCSSKKAAIEAG